MTFIENVAAVVVPLLGLVVPYLVKTHGKTREVLDIVRKLADAADGPEQS